MHADSSAPQNTGSYRDDPCKGPNDGPNSLERDPSCLRGTGVVGDGAQSKADLRPVEEEEQENNERSRCQGGVKVLLRDEDATYDDRVRREPDIEASRLRAPNNLRAPFQDEPETDGSHENRQRRRADQ